MFFWLKRSRQKYHLAEETFLELVEIHENEATAIESNDDEKSNDDSSNMRPRRGVLCLVLFIGVAIALVLTQRFEYIFDDVARENSTPTLNGNATVAALNDTKKAATDTLNYSTMTWTLNKNATAASLSGPKTRGFHVSSDGNCVNVSRNEEEPAIPMGQSICSGKNDHFGHPTAMSSYAANVAPRITIGAGRYPDSSYVCVYEWTGSMWEQIGSEMEMGESYINPGLSVDISSDGTLVVVGEPWYVIDKNHMLGQVLIFRDDSGKWVQQGQTLQDTEKKDVGLGTTVVVSGNGKFLAASNCKCIDPCNLSNATFDSCWRLYYWSQQEWKGIQKISVENEHEWGCGWVSHGYLSDDGTQFTVSNIGSNGEYLQVYTRQSE